jgi:hypothetical protein
VDLPVCENEQYDVLVEVLFNLVALSNGVG